MELVKSPDGVYSVKFATQKGTTGEVCLHTSDETEANQKVTQMRVKELETVSAVVDLTHQVVTQIVAGREVLVEDAISQWLEHVTSVRVLSPMTIETNRSQLLAWARAVDVLRKPITGVTARHVSDYVNAGSERRSTAMRHLSTIRQFFAFCQDQGLCYRNPAGKSLVRVTYDAFTHVEKERNEREVFTDGEIDKLLAIADPFWAAAITIARDTGLRLGDIAKLEWASLDGSTLNVWTDKSNARVSLHVTADISSALGRLPTTDLRYCFPRQRDCAADPRRRSGLSVQFSRLCRAAGLEGTGRGFHCLRHTRATRLVESGRDLSAVAKQLGHGSTAVTQGYVHARTVNQ